MASLEQGVAQRSLSINPINLEYFYIPQKLLMDPWEHLEHKLEILDFVLPDCSSRNKFSWNLLEKSHFSQASAISQGSFSPQEFVTFRIS